MEIMKVDSAEKRSPLGAGVATCYIISVSYGNDSIALIQWAHEMGLENCFVVYCDTGWAHPEWPERVKKGMILADSYGFVTWNVKGMGFEEMVRMKKGFPSQKMQFCSGILKVIPFGDFAEFIDPAKEATVIIGKRRSESRNRANTPEFIIASEHQEGRNVWHPLYKHTDRERNDLIKRAGFKPLPHRSLECCPCVNANRQDLRETPESQIEKLRQLEAETGRELFRAYKHQGAWGIDEVMEWAYSARGKYVKGQLRLWNYKGELCPSGLCGI
jgi:3''-phosphoadenosine 5''-phosphosulfate sulfotransferase (PAPS reductase)/FAD synthetase and related enzymes